MFVEDLDKESQGRRSFEVFGKAVQIPAGKHDLQLPFSPSYDRPSPRYNYHSDLLGEKNTSLAFAPTTTAITAVSTFFSGELVAGKS